MAITFENEKILFDDKYGTAKEIAGSLNYRWKRK